MAGVGNQIFVVGIDIGSTHSGYAFSSKEDPSRFTFSNWQWRTLLSKKVPTCLLLDNNKDFVAFGYEAENIYSTMIYSQQISFYYFRNFRQLLNNQKITQNTTIKEENGKSMDAWTVFSIVLRYFKEKVMQMIQESLTEELSLDDIYYFVLTVPALWDDAAKQLMRAAAEKASIPRHKITIALGPEAALQSCCGQMIDKGMKYIVIDLGDTCKISAYYVGQNEQHYEVVSPVVCQSGGISVNQSFHDFLCDVFGHDIIQSLLEEDYDDYIELFRDFETKKRSITNDQNNRVILPLPFTLLRLLRQKYGNLKNVNIASKYDKNDVYVLHFGGFHGNLHIYPKVFLELFQNTIRDIVKFVKENLKDFLKRKAELREAYTIIVGGFAECALVKLAVETAVNPLMGHLMPIEQDLELVVLKGAVLVGFKGVPKTQEALRVMKTLQSASEFKTLVKKGMYKSYENKVYLAGPSQAGKTSLSSIFLGRPIPQTWKSTNGLTIYFGKNGIDLNTKKMIPLRKEEGAHGKLGIVKKLLHGNPDVKPQVKRKLDENKKPVEKKETEASKKDQESTKVSVNPKPEPKSKILNKNPSTPLKVTKKKQTTTHKERKKTISETVDPSSTATSLHDEILTTIGSGKYKMTVAPSDLVDFGGQRSFDMTHQLFIQYKGSFILLFDGSKGFRTRTEVVQDLKVTAESTFIHWVDSILVYCEKCDDNMPMILFAATHKDQIPKNKLEPKRRKYIKALTDIFSCHKYHTHILYDQLFFINATDSNDPEILQLQDVLVDIACKQKTWGAEMPVAWVPIEMSITDMRDKGSKIVKVSEIKQLNALNGDLALTGSQLEHFLRAYHSRGKILYYDAPVLKDFAVVETSAMVNILRSFVTDEHFWPDDPKMRAIFKALRKTGLISKKDLFILWAEPQFEDIVPTTDHKEFVVKLLIHLDILVEPKTYRNSRSKAYVYLVPCMVRKQAPASLLPAHELSEKAICLIYKLREAAVPSALAFKLIGAVTSIWPLKENDKQICLYFQAATLDVDDKNYFHISVQDKTITVYLVNETSKMFISPDIAASIQECLTMALTQILIFYQRSFGNFEKQVDVSKLFEMKIGEPCTSSKICNFIAGSSTTKFWTCDERVKHCADYPNYWLFKKTLIVCDRNCKGLDSEMLSLVPDEQHLVRLCKLIGIRTFEQFITYLGISRDEWEDIEYQYHGNDVTCKKMIALYLWKRKSLKCSLQSLSDALHQVALDRHLLCKIVREDKTFLAKDQTGLQQIPTDEDLNQLSRNVGNCIVQLGIELGLSFIDVEDTLYRYPKDMYQQTYSILTKWRSKSKNKTVRRLMTSLNNTKCGGLQYLADKFKVSL